MTALCFDLRSFSVYCLCFVAHPLVCRCCCCVDLLCAESQNFVLAMQVFYKGICPPLMVLLAACFRCPLPVRCPPPLMMHVASWCWPSSGSDLRCVEACGSDLDLVVRTRRKSGPRLSRGRSSCCRPSGMHPPRSLSCRAAAASRLSEPAAAVSFRHAP